MPFPFCDFFCFFCTTKNVSSSWLALLYLMYSLKKIQSWLTPISFFWFYYFDSFVPKMFPVLEWLIFIATTTTSLTKDSILINPISFFVCCENYPLKKIQSWWNPISLFAFAHLQTGELYYINWRTGMRATEDPRTAAAAEYVDDCSSEEEDSSSYDSDGSSLESSPCSSREQWSGKSNQENCYYDDEERNSNNNNSNNVLVVAGCKSCLMYYMVPKQLEICPKCCGQLLHFDRSENASSWILSFFLSLLLIWWSVWCWMLMWGVEFLDIRQKEFSFLFQIVPSFFCFSIAM